MKHIPRTWEIVEHSWSDTSIYDNGNLICTHSIRDETTEENQERLEDEASANFKLIAAAPDLLEACKRLVESSACQNNCDPKDMTCDTNFAIKAIIKAQGR